MGDDVQQRVKEAFPALLKQGPCRGPGAGWGMQGVGPEDSATVRTSKAQTRQLAD